MRTLPTSCGASSAATAPAPGRRRCPTWTGWSATRSPTTGISFAPRSSTAIRTEQEREALADLAETLRGMGPEALMRRRSRRCLDQVGKLHRLLELRAWFGCLYQVLLGQKEGPRFGGFIALYGVTETIALIEAVLTRPVAATAD